MRSLIHCHRQFSTSVLTPASDDATFPSRLLSKLPAAASERTLGMYVCMSDVIFS